jgi:hypothetical protein
MDKEEKIIDATYIKKRIAEKREKRNKNAIAHLYGIKVKYPRVRKKKKEK